jgi:septal ring factor EnvC (AmiA/AmiB activator)
MSADDYHDNFLTIADEMAAMFRRQSRDLQEIENFISEGETIRTDLTNKITSIQRRLDQATSQMQTSRATDTQTINELTAYVQFQTEILTELQREQKTVDHAIHSIYTAMKRQRSTDDVDTGESPFKKYRKEASQDNKMPTTPGMSNIESKGGTLNIES